MGIDLKGISKDDWLTWACFQFPLLWIVGLNWTLIAMAISGVLGTLGGWQYGSKWFKWAGIPICVCTLICIFNTHSLYIFLAAPFMVKIAPSYGKSSGLANIIYIKNETLKDAVLRLICFNWYWGAVFIALYIGGIK